MKGVLQLFAGFLAGVALLTFSVLPAYANATVDTESFQIPFNQTQFVSCANNGVGEYVDLTGTMHIQFRNVNNDETNHTSGVLNLQSVSGVGETTGTTYIGVWSNPDNLNVSAQDGASSSHISAFRLIGQGTGAKLSAQFVFHITLDANGQLTAFVNNFTLTCK